MEIQAELAAVRQYCVEAFPSETLALMAQGAEELLQTGIMEQSLKTGDRIPSFSLPNQNDISIASDAILNQGFMVLSFLRGSWCPYCQIELAGLEVVLPSIRELGANAVVITPQVRRWRKQQAEIDIPFDVEILRDRGNQIARQFGLVFQVPAYLRPIYQGLGFALPRFNGDDSFELPIPATYVVNPQGEIIYSFVNADFSQRPDPIEIIIHLRRFSAGTTAEA